MYNLVKYYLLERWIWGSHTFLECISKGVKIGRAQCSFNDVSYVVL